MCHVSRLRIFSRALRTMAMKLRRFAVDVEFVLESAEATCTPSCEMRWNFKQTFEFELPTCLIGLRERRDLTSGESTGSTAIGSFLPQFSNPFWCYGASSWNGSLVLL
jgi:hypothetical protein